jgi:ABC-type dipeptide/oligopeptide/nickel transport system ATPase component
MADERLLDVKDLKTYFDTDEGTVKAVDGVSFHINKGETLAVVGESGSGKSVTSLSIMRLIATPPGRIAGGQILFNGRDLVKLSEREMRGVRGNDISMIFQEPMTSLNPVYTVGDQIAEAIVLHGHARASRYPRTRQARSQLPTPNVRGDAPAGDDCHGPLLRSATPDC